MLLKLQILNPSGDEDILDLFNAAGRLMLVLGEPGSGKTTLLLDLTRSLLAQAEANINQPIPVVLNLSTWSERRLPFIDWLVREMSAQYRLGRSDCRSWIKGQCPLFLLLDGLDEVKPVAARVACVEAINAFCRNISVPGIVVTCRQNEYESLQTTLALIAEIHLQSLTTVQIESFVAENWTRT
jgi:predicted NACHT family NTPase